MMRSSVAVMVEEVKESARFRIQDIQLLHDASELLIECRLVLAWTYVYAFFERDESQRRLFEFVQKDLETKTELLSLMVENRPTADVLNERIKLLDYVSAVRGFLENIKQYTQTDPVEARWPAAAIAKDPAPPVAPASPAAAQIPPRRRRNK